MKWTNITKVKKFTPLDQVFLEIKEPIFKMDNKPVYYMGNGFLISYSPKQFRVENCERVEYGEVGEFALNAYYFGKRQHLEKYFKIENEIYLFEKDELLSPFIIIDEIGVNSTYEQVTSYFRQRSNLVYYREGETREFNNGRFAFVNNFVTWGNYTFFFFGNSRKTRVSGFKFTFIG